MFALDCRGIQGEGPGVFESGEGGVDVAAGREGPEGGGNGADGAERAQS